MKNYIIGLVLIILLVFTMSGCFEQSENNYDLNNETKNDDNDNNTIKDENLTEIILEDGTVITGNISLIEIIELGVSVENVILEFPLYPTYSLEYILNNFGKSFEQDEQMFIHGRAKNTAGKMLNDVEIIIHCSDNFNNYLASYNESTKYLPKDGEWEFYWTIDFWHIVEEEIDSIGYSFVNRITIEINAT